MGKTNNFNPSQLSPSSSGRTEFYQRLGWVIFSRRFGAVKRLCDRDDIQDVRQIIELSWILVNTMSKDELLRFCVRGDDGPDITRIFIRHVSREFYLFARIKGVARCGKFGFERVETRLIDDFL